MSDLMRMMRDAAAEPTEYPDVDRAWRRARLHRAGFVALSLVAVIAVTGGAVIAASSIGESDTRPALPGEIEVGGGGAIAFTRFSIDGGIYRMAPDGSGVTKIIDDSRSEVDDPAWSPDGTKIAFHGYFDGARARTEGAIYVTDADGSNRTTVAIGSVSPSWGPNNDEVVFSALFEPSPGLTQGGIFRNDAHGEPLGLISRDKPNALDVSPDGRKIVFSLDGLYVVGIDSGQTDKILTPSDTFHHPTDPQWSPDGAHIAFTTPADQEGHTTVDVIDADGSNRRTITDGSSPTWSPDGTRIAFERIEGEVSHIYSIAIDGSDLQQLTFGPDSDHSPDWGAAPTDATPEPPDCPAVGEGGYQMTLEPPNPSPGTQVSATGPIPMYGEDGSYSPPGADEAVHFWLDADEKRWEDLIEPGLQPDKDPGKGVRYLGSQSLADPTLCTFEFAFDMPDVPPGEHSVVPVMFGGGGAAPYDAAVLLIEDRNADESSRCSYPSIRPTYLPWQTSGNIPEPDHRSYWDDIDRAGLLWTNPENRNDGVWLTVYPLDGQLSPEEPIGVTLRGATGYLHDGPPGEHSAWWDLDEHCNALELSVSLEGMSPEAVDKEVVKIARSLEE